MVRYFTCARFVRRLRCGPRASSRPGTTSTTGRRSLLLLKFGLLADLELWRGARRYEAIHFLYLACRAAGARRPAVAVAALGAGPAHDAYRTGRTWCSVSAASLGARRAGQPSCQQCRYRQKSSHDLSLLRPDSRRGDPRVWDATTLISRRSPGMPHEAGSDSMGCPAASRAGSP